MRSGCCARATSGQPTATPPISMMKSRRLMASPKGSQDIQVSLFYKR
jgi:hypothetical protein